MSLVIDTLWPKLDPTPALSGATIDVWHLPLTNAIANPALLNPIEQARADRLLLADKRLQFVAARSQLKSVLGHYTDRPPRELEFHYGDHGKPVLKEYPNLSFNLSHSHTRGLLAVTHGTDIGIDLEYRQPNRRLLALAQRFFSTTEAHAFASLETSAQDEAFYRTWACKEAYLKAWGTGLTFPSNKFSIEPGRRARPKILDSEMPGDSLGSWQLQVLHVAPDYAGAVCYRGALRGFRHFICALDAPQDTL